jgi:phytoene/squalene synthetase
MAVGNWLLAVNTTSGGSQVIRQGFRTVISRTARPAPAIAALTPGSALQADSANASCHPLLRADSYAPQSPVASVVGLTIIHIFGFESPYALALAEKCAIAFQLTNILRDVREDRENGRIYIPEEDIRKFGAGLTKHDERFVKLMSFEAQRARAYYDESRPLIALVHPRSRPSLWR